MQLQNSKYWYIKGGVIFSQLTEEDYKELEWISCMVQCKKNDFVYLPEKKSRKVYYLKVGLVKLGYYNEQGNEIIIDILKPGDIFGEIGFGSTIYTEEFAQSLTNDTKLCNFDIEQLEIIFEKNPRLALSFTKKVGKQQLEITRRFSKIIYTDSKTRLIDFFKSLIEQNGIIETKNIKFENYLTHQDLASLNGLARQTVSSLLSQFKDQGILFFDRSKVVIPDLNLLK